MSLTDSLDREKRPKKIREVLGPELKGVETLKVVQHLSFIRKFGRNMTAHENPTHGLEQ